MRRPGRGGRRMQVAAPVEPVVHALGGASEGGGQRREGGQRVRGTGDKGEHEDEGEEMGEAGREIWAEIRGEI